MSRQGNVADFALYQQKLSDYLADQIPDYTSLGLKGFVAHFFNENAEQLDTEPEFEDMKPVMLDIISFLSDRAKETSKIEFLNSMFNENGEFPVFALLEDDRPFIVESMQMQLERLNIAPMHRFSALYVVLRDKYGKLQKIAPYTGQKVERHCHIESLVVYQLATSVSGELRQSILETLGHTLEDIAFVHEDWAQMIVHAQQSAGNLSQNSKVTATLTQQIADFMACMIEDHFTFLAVMQFDYRGDFRKNSSNRHNILNLGLARNNRYALLDSAVADFSRAELANFAENSNCCYRIIKSSLASPLRRDVNLDILIVKRYDAQGQCIGDTVYAGLFAWAVYARPLTDLPLLQQKAQNVLDHFQAETKSYSGRQLIHLCDNYPRNQMLQVTLETLFEHIHILRRVYRRREFGVLPYFEGINHTLSLTVYILRADYSSGLRESMMLYLQDTLRVNTLLHEVHLPNDAIWRVHFTLFLSPEQEVPDGSFLTQISDELQKMSRSSFDRLRQELSKGGTPEFVSRICQQYGNAFSQQYWRQHTIETVVKDIEQLENMAMDGQSVRAILHKEADRWQVRLYNLLQDRIYLSDVMPMLERMGLRALQQESYRLQRQDGQQPSILVFHVRHDLLQDDIPGSTYDHFSQCLDALFEQKIEIDEFLSLVLRANLSWRDINMLRTYAKYMRQLRVPYSLRFIAETLNLYPDISRHLVSLFYARFHPDHADSKKEKQCLATMTEALNDVSILDQDMMLSLYKNLMLATLRTNFFQTTEDGGHHAAISIKLAPRSLEGIPLPVPLREIFVYSTAFEAVHLRFGEVSRGGLRWSDRTEDFRTEVLGLVKAQQVKNAVIVPMGSKGGFVLKNPSADRQSFMEEGVRCYRQFIGSMLAITDSYGAGQSVRKPQQVVCQDDDDPYLVVAADKGTATFSDFANDVSAEHEFWLGDAFASGGSVGYDHKKMGITARGAWESVKRHFREMGHNTQTTPFNVVGVGDMSGDVFGNGMLLSEHIRLIGAFNHLHIFVDPDPDPETSFAERQRLFNLPRSQWTDYNVNIMSEGGCVFRRDAKTLTLTLPIRARLGLSQDTIAPNDLIRRLLTMDSDLLWFGGIGTYIKCKGENHQDAGDKANDAIRINGEEVGARVIGEGANLGVTQLARIEFAQNGGRCNTDAIDNSAGVNCSDNEVNIKILVGEAINNGNLPTEERVALLESMTDEVGELVLVNNYQQTLSLSVTESSGARLLGTQQRVMKHFERIGELNRLLEGLPNDEEIEIRRNQSQGLTRPELAVLLAYGKNITYQTLLGSDFLDNPALEHYLVGYFPKVLQERFHDEILNHQLRRQIIATVITNTVINRSGVGFIVEMQEATGRAVDEICAAYMTVVEIFDLNSIWQQVEALDNLVDSTLQHQMFAETAMTIRRMTEWLLIHSDESLSMQEKVSLYGRGLQVLSQVLTSIISVQAMQIVDARTQRFVHAAVPEALSQHVGRLKVLSSVLDIVSLAEESKKDVAAVAQCYFAVSDRFHLDRLRTAANELQSNDNWTMMALSAAIDDLWQVQSDITRRVLALGKGKENADMWLNNWLGMQKHLMSGIDSLYNDLLQHQSMNVAMFSVLQRQLKTLAV